MKLHHLRNATFIIKSGPHSILVDPMLGDKGSLPPFALFRHKAIRNPIVSLPENASLLLDKVTACLITHCRTFGIKAFQHTDHLDGTGETFLKSGSIPVTCPEKDGPYLRKLGLSVEKSLPPWNPTPYKGGKITAIPAQHGYGWVHHLMANGAGFFIELPDEPSLYISGDTIFTPEVKRALTQLQPDIAVVAAGSASLDIGDSLLMSPEGILSFIQTAPGKVIANHMEALNHCPTTRTKLKQMIKKVGLEQKVWIPEDGEAIESSYFMLL